MGAPYTACPWRRSQIQVAVSPSLYTWGLGRTSMSIQNAPVMPAARRTTRKARLGHICVMCWATIIRDVRQTSASAGFVGRGATGRDRQALLPGIAQVRREGAPGRAGLPAGRAGVLGLLADPPR